jgi:outer membrane biosynthesis protein TonB
MKYLIIGVHLLFCSMLFFSSFAPRKQHPILIRSVALQQPTPQHPKGDIQQTPKRPNAPAPKQKPPDRPSHRPAAPRKQKPPPSSSPPSPKPPVKQATSQVTKQGDKERALAKEIAATIAKIDAQSEKIEQSSLSLKIALPTPSQSATEASPLASKIISQEIHRQLAIQLQNILRLPAEGEVTLELTLERDGSVEAVKIVRSANQINSNYLLKELKNQAFPQLTALGPLREERTFVITFCNTR